MLLQTAKREIELALIKDRRSKEFESVL